MSPPRDLQYETKLVTLPIVTATQRQYPDRVGPWRIKRSQSASDATPKIVREFHERRPEDLKKFLAKIDEQCSQIDQITTLHLKRHDEDHASSNLSTLCPSFHTPDWGNTEARTTVNAYDRHRTGWYHLIYLLLLCISLLFAVPGALVYLLNNGQVGSIQLSEEAPSIPVLCSIVAIAPMSVGFIIAIAVASVFVIGHGIKITAMRLWGLVGGGLALGMVLTLWTLSMILEVTERI